MWVGEGERERVERERERWRKRRRRRATLPYDVDYFINVEHTATY